MEAASKRCSRCRVEKSPDQFYKRSRSSDGLQNNCKECHLTYGRREDAKAVVRDWREANKERLQVQARAWRQANKERQAATGKAWRAANRDQVADRRRARRLQRTYGLTPEAFDALLLAQGSACAICGTDDPGVSHGQWHIDHCHDTNLVRGILCHGCNVGLGYFKDDPARLASAIDYLARAAGEQQAA